MRQYHHYVAMIITVDFHRMGDKRGEKGQEKSNKRMKKDAQDSPFLEVCKLRIIYNGRKLNLEFRILSTASIWILRKEYVFCKFVIYSVLFVILFLQLFVIYFSYLLFFVSKINSTLSYVYAFSFTHSFTLCPSICP